MSLLGRQSCSANFFFVRREKHMYSKNRFVLETKFRGSGANNLHYCYSLHQIPFLALDPISAMLQM